MNIKLGIIIFLVLSVIGLSISNVSARNYVDVQINYNNEYGYHIININTFDNYKDSKQIIKELKEHEIIKETIYNEEPAYEVLSYSIIYILVNNTEYRVHVENNWVEIPINYTTNNMGYHLINYHTFDKYNYKDEIIEMLLQQKTIEEIKYKGKLMYNIITNIKEEDWTPDNTYTIMLPGGPCFIRLYR
jgi:hypothetical protein